MSTETPGRINATVQQKAAMFEWLRGIALSDDRHALFAGIAMQELNEIAGARNEARRLVAFWQKSSEEWKASRGRHIERAEKAEADLATARASAGAQDDKELDALVVLCDAVDTFSVKLLERGILITPELAEAANSARTALTALRQRACGSTPGIGCLGRCSAED